MQDLFNNISNDYIYPDLPPCPGASDKGTFTFEFLPNEQVGIVSGSNVIASMELGDIIETILGWDQKIKILQPGEVTFIAGGTKGISKRTQFFPFIGDVAYTGANHAHYMDVDISLNHYIQFKHEDSIFSITSSPNERIDIAFNRAFDASGININVTYTKEGLLFKGKTAGYLFDVENVIVTLHEPDSSSYTETLLEDTEQSIPSFKYPNTAMLGYVLKVVYPNKVVDSDSYVEINHVPDYLEYFTEVKDATLGCYTRNYKAIDVGLNKSCDEDVMSSGDYLNYISENDKWEKVGKLRIWLSSQDALNSTDENLITGFYVYNPHDFPVQISYITIN